MKLTYETSLSAYLLLDEIRKGLNIKEAPEESIKNGNIKKIMTYCNKAIEKRYSSVEQQIKLKMHIENIFYQK